MAFKEIARLSRTLREHDWLEDIVLLHNPEHPRSIGIARTRPDEEATRSHILVALSKAEFAELATAVKELEE